MNVYDEYVKSQGPGPAGGEDQQQPQINGGENLQPGVEGVKDAEA